ncbi:MAG TPA: type II CAAX endopeptidase family protein [Acidobacteriota bacterium]|nr:type II CAAX endopeptidase family protein [Acidobacteriota bacterium]
MRGPSQRALFGPRGLRAGWRLLIFNAAFFLLGILMKTVLVPVVGPDPEWTAWNFIIIEVVALAGSLACVYLMAGIERRRFADYGFTRAGAFGRLFWQGGLWGLATIGAVVAIMALAGGYAVRGLALEGVDLVLSAFLWAAGFLVASLLEEIVFRGYELFTLASGIRFWPAAVALSVFFGFYLHYAQKPHETLVDGASVTLIALFFCLTVRRTGDLWFAIGWHWTFNFGALFLFGFPNTGNRGGLPISGRLLEAATSGPAWLTGGPMGAEASLIIFPVLAVLFAAFHFRYREVRYRGNGRGAIPRVSVRP